MNRRAVISNYEQYDEEKRAFRNRADQIEFVYTKKLLDQYIAPTMSVLELGCGTGYYGLYLSDKCRSYHGVDLTPKHIEQFQAKISEQKRINLSASVGDATNLPHMESDSYNVILVFGPMYHLSRAERQKVMQESKRICKPGGMVLFAYINKIGAYLRACMDTEMKATYPTEKANDTVLRKGFDDVLPDVFFFTMPEEMEQDAKSHGFTVIDNVGVNFIFNMSDMNDMTEEKYALWTEIFDVMFQSKSCTGVSNHAVLVCRKEVVEKC